MKKLLLLLVTIFYFSPNLSFAQFDCSDGRFDTPDYFPNVTVTDGVKFGENANPTMFNPNVVAELFMDIYQPEGDTTNTRPVIIWAFGGAFVGGSRTSPDIVELCNRYARLGYVTIAIDYRLTPDLIFFGSTELAYNAVQKGMHDMRAAVRFLRKDIEENNTYRIHPNHVYVGGVSAGGFCALHTAYLDKLEEVPVEIVADSTEVGGIEGLSGTPGYSSEVNGVINLCGAIGDSTWIEPGNVPVVSMHGTMDGTVPYGSETITLFNLNLPVDGSASLHERGLNIGINTAFKTWYGADHVPFIDSELYMDSTFNYTKAFMLPLVCNPMTVDVDETPKEEMNITISPNPADIAFTVELETDNPQAWIYQLTDMNGRVIEQKNVNNYVFQINRNQLPAGIYFLRLSSPDRQVVRKVVFR